MKTAVEWLVEQLNQKIDYIPLDKWDMIRDIVEQAKEMEKEQIIKHSLELAKILISNHYETSGKTRTELTDSYINETFKSE
jgi:hypothetical protein